MNFFFLYRKNTNLLNRRDLRFLGYLHPAVIKNDNLYIYKGRTLAKNSHTNINCAQMREYFFGNFKVILELMQLFCGCNDKYAYFTNNADKRI